MKMYCRQCGYKLGEAEELARLCPGDTPQSWGYAPEEVEWFCASHGADLHLPEVEEQNEAIWLSPA
jgi:hypothetical protein